MPFEVKVESDKLLQQFEDMQKRVTELDQKLPQVFLDWQREDMNRKFPKIDEQAGLSVTTLRLSALAQASAPTRAAAASAAKRKQARRRVVRHQAADPAPGAGRATVRPHDRDVQGGHRMAVNFSTLVYLPNYDMFARADHGDAAGVAAGCARVCRARDLRHAPGRRAGDGRLDHLRSADHPRRARRRIHRRARAARPHPHPGRRRRRSGCSASSKSSTPRANGGGETTLVLRKIVTAKPS